MLDEDKGLYAIGTVAQLIDEHPETIRVWERNKLIFPDRQGYQRKYSNNDLKRLMFIKSLIHDKGLNLAGVRQMISMYPCWYKRNCRGGKAKNTLTPVNESKPCWKQEGTYCLIPSDQSELCSACELFKKCGGCPMGNSDRSD